MALSGEWKKFVSEFNPAHFWYVPHSHVDKPELRDILTIFAEFDGKVWHDRSVLKRLQAEGLTGGTGAGPRMMRKAMENLALCWIEDHVLRITPAGRALIDGADKNSLLERLLWRYRIGNPVNETPRVDVFAHAALVRMLLALDGRITRDEYLLFAGRTRSDDVASTIDLVLAWRKLPPTRQDEVIAALRRAFSTLQTAGGYSMGFHRCASYLRSFTDSRGRKGLEIKKKQRDKAAASLARHDESATIVTYANRAEWIAAHGSVEQASAIEDALDYYIDTSQPAKAVEIFARLPVAARGGRTVEEFTKAIFLEKDLEDYLEKNIEKIEPGLKLIKRQRAVVVGTIDLLAKAENGDLVVIELKKVRASDKVFGQLCRYMGCVSAHHAEAQQKVRGYIVGSEIDEKLRYAARIVPKDMVKLKRFRKSDDDPDIFIED